MKQTGNRRALIMVLAVTCGFSAVGVLSAASPAMADTQGDWTFEVVDGNAHITDWSGVCGTTSCTPLVIPTTLGGHPVTEINGALSSNGQNGLAAATGITLPASLTAFGDSSLNNLNNLVTLTLPVGFTTVGSNALANVGSDSGHPRFVLPSSLTHIGGGSFGGTYIDPSNALAHLTYIGTQIFGADSSGGGAARTQQHLRNSSNSAITSLNLASIEILEPQAFRNSGITSLTLGPNLREMYAWGDGGLAFADNSLTSVTIPGSLATIASYAFYNNPLSSVVINNGVTAIDTGAFTNASATHSITSLTLPNSIVTIGSNAFDGALSSSVSSLSLPTALTTIGDYAFNQARLSSLTLNSSLRTIGAHAFDHALGPGVTSLTFPAGVSSIGEYAFANNNLENLTIPASVRTIGVGAFAKMGPQTITYVPPVFSGLTPSSGEVGTSFTTTFGASGASLAVKSGDALPDGLTLDSDTGVLSGIPTTAGTYVFRLVATNADPASTANSLSPSNTSPYTSSQVTLTVSGASPSPNPGGGGADSGPTPAPSASPSPSSPPIPTPEVSQQVVVTALPNTFATVPQTVTGAVTRGVTTVSSVPTQGVERLAATVSDSPASAPVVAAPSGAVVITQVSGLAPNTDFAVTMTPTSQARSRLAAKAAGALGHVRSTSKGVAKLPPVRVTRTGVYLIQLQSASGKASFMKLAVKRSAKPARKPSVVSSARK